MKLFTTLFVVALLATPLAQAQVYFGSGSATPKNPGAATRDLDRRERAAPHAKPRSMQVRCRDGSRHIARVCRRHGGIAGR
jgi:Ni/Co efflux regulator RcnB